MNVKIVTALLLCAALCGCDRAPYFAFPDQKCVAEEVIFDRGKPEQRVLYTTECRKNP